MKLTLKLGQIARADFLAAFRKLRALGLPCAYELALCAGTIEVQAAAYREAHEALVKRLGEAFEEGAKDTPKYVSGFKVTPQNLPQFLKELAELDAKPVELPVAHKLKIGPLNGQLCADDLIPLIDLVEP